MIDRALGILYPPRPIAMNSNCTERGGVISEAELRKHASPTGSLILAARLYHNFLALGWTSRKNKTVLYTHNTLADAWQAHLCAVYISSGDKTYIIYVCTILTMHGVNCEAFVVKKYLF